MNRQAIVRDLEAAPARVASELMYDIRRRPDLAIPVALVFGFFLGLLLRRTPLVRESLEPEEREPSWREILGNLKHSFR